MGNRRNAVPLAEMHMGSNGTLNSRVSRVVDREAETFMTATGFHLFGMSGPSFETPGIQEFDFPPKPGPDARVIADTIRLVCLVSKRKGQNATLKQNLPVRVIQGRCAGEHHV